MATVIEIKLIETQASGRCILIETTDADTGTNNAREVFHELIIKGCVDHKGWHKIHANLAVKWQAGKIAVKEIGKTLNKPLRIFPELLQNLELIEDDEKQSFESLIDLM